MGRLGRLPVELPEGVSAELKEGVVEFKGPKGAVALKLSKNITVTLENGKLVVARKSDSKRALAMHGTIRSHLANIVHGISEGWTKKLLISGPGYRGEVKDNTLHLSVGYSHPVIIEAPERVSFKVEKNLITVEGIDKQVVGQTAALVRDSRRPNVYTGSGISYEDEQVRRKAGKQTAGGE